MKKKAIIQITHVHACDAFFEDITIGDIFEVTNISQIALSEVCNGYYKGSIIPLNVITSKAFTGDAIYVLGIRFKVLFRW